ncbi:LOW QUALITY PROTEIN: coiled-coil domain-containing protein 66-like, partial [Bombina bombina]|uniref:LOW QUALITY PROTEIN: coiled-coil domain-containing protein 66-like n=1 Tax=Bombina bombina TaxID=8345 RepID=UPI00235AA195
MHFDSFKKQNTHPPIHNQIQQYENQLPSRDVAHSEEPSVSPATSYLHRSGSVMQKSLDEDNVQGQKTGFLRTMTSLLDPVQIEERDKKRLKRMEHEKALAAQVEERRKKKQQEEERRLREEQEEEQKLLKEREQIRKQFEEDAFRQKQKEEIVSLKTKELYQSMQRAQEEAQRIKQEQRMRHLAQKGHDISKLQRNLNGEVEQLDQRSSSRFTDVTPVDLRSGTNSAMKQTHTTLVSPRKDTAVQTDDVNSLMNAGWKKKHREERLWRDLQNYSPDIPIEFKDKGNSDVHMRTLAIKEKSKSSKENKNTLTNENDHLARTENQVKESVKRPDWNKNKPNKRFLPASERYPKGLQKQREESKIRRQKELLNLVERNNVNNLQQRKRTSPERTTSPDNIMVAVMNEESQGKQTTRKEEQLQKVDSNFKRPVSPPVPAVKNRLHQMEKRPSGISSHFVYNGNAVQGHTYTSKQIEVFPESSEQASERPPSSHFIPYVRTKEIYYLDPDAPMSRPSTHDPQYRYE